MPAPVATQGSRGGLITAVVVFTILFVVSTIFAIFYGVAANKAEADVLALRKQYKDVAGDAALFPEVQQLAALAKSSPALSASEKTALQLLLFQRNELAKKVAGAAGAAQKPIEAADEAITKANDALAQAKTKLPNISLPSSGDNLVGAVQTLASALTTLSEQNADVSNRANSGADQSSKAIAAMQIKVDSAQKELDDKSAEIKKLQDDNVAALLAKDTQVNEIMAAIAKERDDYSNQLKQGDTQRADLARQVQSLSDQTKQLKIKLGGRKLPVEPAIVRAPDASIIRIPSNDTVYIDIGQGDHVTPGLTFEVYDKNERLPEFKDGMSPDNMPVGKASIEVTKVGPTWSECHVVKRSIGQNLVLGDPIINLIYDKNTKFNFVVYGDFDLDGNGVATPGETEQIQRLVTQWGGKLQDHISVDTDFVVMGKEPTVPTATPDELNDPFMQKKIRDAQASLDAYNATIDQAKDLHIPIMNQNRFLYYIGYYAQAPR